MKHVEYIFDIAGGDWDGCRLVLAEEQGDWFGYVVDGGMNLVDPQVYGARRDDGTSRDELVEVVLGDFECANPGCTLDEIDRYDEGVRSDYGDALKRFADGGRRASLSDLDWFQEDGKWLAADDKGFVYTIGYERDSYLAEAVDEESGSLAYYERFFSVESAMEGCAEFSESHIARAASRRGGRVRAGFWNPNPQAQELMDMDGRIWDKYGWDCANQFYDESGNRGGPWWDMYVVEVEFAMRDVLGIYPGDIDPGTIEDLEDGNFHSLLCAMEELGYFN